jgi:hypothetical protein
MVDRAAIFAESKIYRLCREKEADELEGRVKRFKIFHRPCLTRPLQVQPADS